MSNPRARRRVRFGMLCAVCALASSGASRPKRVAAHAREASASPPAAAASPRISEAPRSALPEPMRASTAPMLTVPKGEYLPFYKGKSGTRTISVPAFQIAASPVSEADLLAFVSASPGWRRSRVGRLFAEATYLADWNGDVSLGSARAEAVATRVSWFAAKAYCARFGQRLPTTVEWERALGVLGSTFAATSGSGSTLAASLWEWTADFNSVPVAGDDNDASGSVATLFCGAGARATDATDYGAFLRYSFRSSLRADFALKNLGFRCAAGAP